MTTLLINDLPVSEELDRKQMAAVRGGMYKGMPTHWNPLFDISKSDVKFDASQILGQAQNTVVNNGNNVAFASGITSTVNPTQTGSNNINFL